MSSLIKYSTFGGKMKPIGVMVVINIFLIKLLVPGANCFNLSTVVDKDELWHLLLSRQISQNDSIATHLAPSSSPSHKSNVVNAVRGDKASEFSYDTDGDFNDDEVKVDYVVSDETDEKQNTILDNNLKSVFSNIFNVSDVKMNETAGVVGLINNSKSDKIGFISSEDNLSGDRKYPTVNYSNSKSKRQEYPSVTPSVIAIDVFKPSETDLDNEDIETFQQKEEHMKIHQRPKPGQTSLIIVFDGTGSMENCLIQLRTGAKQIIDKFANRDDNPIYNYIFVPFRDPDIGPELVTTNQKELLDVLDNLKLYGGGDCPEATLNGISSALKYALPKSYVYVFTDAIAKDFSLDSQVLHLIQKRQTTITFLLTGFCKSKDSPGYEVFKRLAAASNGQVYNLKTQEIKDVLEDIKNSLDQRRVSLKYLDSKTGDEHSIDVSIDDNLKEFSVSVAGLNPNISVIDPRKEIYDKGKEVLNLENLKVINVENPIPGEWNVKAKSDSAHSVRLTAISDIVFNFGFTLKAPKTISETFFNPLQDELNILTISPSNNTLIHNLTSVQITLFYDKKPEKPITFELKLKKIDGNNETDDLYVTQPFEPPRQPFKIDIKGFDIYGNALQRLLSTVVQSTEEGPPEVFIERQSIEINETQSFTINCHVKSIIPMLVQLKWHNRILEEIKVDQTSSIELNIDDASRRDSGKYVCSAVNRRGYAEGWIHVTVRPRLINVSIPIHHYNVVENDPEIVIYCEVSQKNADVMWSFNGRTLNDLEYEFIGSHLLLKNLKRKYSGSYTCTGRSIYGDYSNDTTTLTVAYATEIIGDSFQFRAIQYNDQLNLSCPVHGVPTPQIIWFKKQNDDTIELPFTENVEIKEFKSHDEGIYVCQAQNQIGVSQEIKYHVTGRADVAPSIVKSNLSIVQVKLGDDIKINCKCSMCMPLTELQWFFIEQQQNTQMDQHLSMDEIGKNEALLTLEIINATEKNEGIYTCRLGNRHGYDEMDVKVEVLSPPKIENLSIENPTQIRENEVIVEGRSAHIKCEVKGLPMPIIHWWKDGVPIIYDGRITNNNKTLIVKETQTTDAGVYECHAINPLGEITRNFTLLVVVPPKLTSAVEPLKTMIEGDNVLIPCEVYALPPPSISWIMNGNTLNIEEGKYLVDNNSLSFQASASDSGIYQCIASNEIGNAMQELVLLIYVEPKIYPLHDEIIEVHSNSDVTLKCDATGFPLPNISWSHEGRTIDNSDFIENFGDGEIILRNISVSSEGGYICDAFNGIGITQKIFYIIVNDPPIITTDLPTNMTVLPGERIYLECEAIGNPVPYVYWKTDRNEYFDEIRFPKTDLLMIDATSLTKATSIICTCYAENSIGSQSKDVVINLIDVPQMINDTSQLKFEPTKDVVMYDDIELECPYKSYDKLSWFKNNKPIGHISLHQQQDNNRLQLSMVMPGTAGNYTCIVENEAGEANYTYEINVLSPPHILEIDENLTNEIPKNISAYNVYEIMVALGESVVVNCLADGNPQPEILWKRNDVLITRNSQLRIEFATLSDGGLYTCVAINSMGEDRVQYKLEVFSEPYYEKGESEQFLQVNLNEKFILDCEMIGNPIPTVSWTKDGITMRGINKSTLEIIANELSAEGMYTCEGRNRFGVETITFNVTIFAKPEITFTTPNTTILSTDQLKLTCQAFGIPKPILTWQYNGQLLLTTSRIYNDNKINSATTYNNNKIYINQYGNSININSFPQYNHTVDLNNINEMKRYYGSVRAAAASSSHTTNNDNEITFDLILPSMAKKHSGKFSCIAANAIGRDEKHSFVKVLVFPTFKNGSIKRNIEVLQGMPIILPCSPSGQPRPDIYWFKDSNELRMNKNVKLIEDGQLLTILESVHDDSGEYYCLAKNIAGESRLLFDVRVMVPPSILTSNAEKGDPLDDDIIEHITANEGDNLQLNCPVVGYPVPKITWLKLNYADQYIEEILPHNETILNIAHITDFSTFTCFANSSFGEIKLVFHITVHKPPRLENADDKLLKVKMYHGFTLDCKVNGVPEPNVTWFKDGSVIHTLTENQFISTDGQFFRTISTQKSHTGRYNCVVKNDLGTVQRIFDVEVYESVHWSPWGFWSECSTSCGPGLRRRSRICLKSNGKPANSNCIGETYQMQPCELSPCSINGGWSDWSEWTKCSLSCVNEHSTMESIRERHRRCDSPIPKLGGKPCSGNEIVQEICSVPFCPINGGWSKWNAWSSCSVSCGSGMKIRTRNCNDPPASHGGAYCEGNNSESMTCSMQSCAVDGGWSDWSQWTVCSKNCGKGQKYRRRECNSPAPNNGGAVCDGSNFEMKNCKIRNSKNADLTKSSKLAKYTPFITIPSSDENDKGDDDYYDNDESSNIEYMENRPTEYVPPPSIISRNQRPQTVIVRVENYIPLSKDTAQISLNLGRHVGPVTLSHPIKCDLGYESKSGQCQDIDECDSQIHKCSHLCVNTNGSYNCQCPSGMKLAEDLRRCFAIISHNIYSRPQRDNPSEIVFLRGFVKYAQMVCPDGYLLHNETCLDIDECQEMTDDCSTDQKCMNTKGSYLCIPTPCPDYYDRDELSGQCIQLCSQQPNQTCTDNAKVAQTISYTILSMKTLNFDVPVLKLVNYDMNRRPLEMTHFSFAEQSAVDSVFVLERIPNKMGIVYLYAKQTIEKTKVYKIKVLGLSYDNSNPEGEMSLMYITNFIIYVYVA